MNYQIKNIEWIPVIFAHMPESNSITTQILVKAWSIYETKDINWISHFLEHMFFKGWKKYKTPKQVSQAIDQIGGEFNAFTSEEYAWYWVKSAPNYINIALDVLADMLVNAQFPKDELEREKWVVIQEIKMYEDMPHRLVLDLFKEYYYGNNSFGWPILWPEENILKFNQDMLFDYKDKLYTKDNMVIVIAWNIQNQSKLEKLISKLFKNLPEKKKLQTPPLPKHKPKKNEKAIKKQTQQNHLVIGIPGYSIFDNKKYAATILATILGGNMSSILFQEVREKKGLCYYIGMSHYVHSQDWLYIIRAGLQKDKFELWKKTIYKILDKIQKGQISERQFKKALWYIKGKTQMWIETSDQMADFVGEQYLITDKIKTLDEILKEYEKVTLKDLQNLASQMTKNKRFALWIE